MILGVTLLLSYHRLACFSDCKPQSSMPPHVTGTSWPAGVIWGSQAGNANNAQANLAEFTIGGAGGQDTYDISNVVRLTRSAHPLAGAK